MADVDRLEAERREIDALFRALIEAQRKSTKASEARAALPAGSSRARVTTANARWMRASEYRDLCEARLREVVPLYDVMTERVVEHG